MNKDLAKLDLKPIVHKTAKIIRRHFITIIIVTIAILYGYLVLQINILNRKQPSESDVQQGIQQVKKPNIDTQTVNKLKALEDNSQEVKSLFKAARENPFQE